MTLLSAVTAICTQYGYDRTYWVAYSGGLDSHVLLSLCHALQRNHPIKLQAIHVNHGLSPHANDWLAHCTQICGQYGVPLLHQTITLALKAGESLEEKARDCRYEIFARHLKEGDILLTAHHQDDQAETVLMQLLRGSGVKGLMGMPRVKPLAKGWQARPLLPFSRAELKDYADQAGLKWVEDESNQCTRLTRNFLRQTILSQLKTRFPSVTATLARSAAHCQEAQVLLEEFALSALENLKGTEDATLSVKKLLALEPKRQYLVLRTWINSLGHPLPDTKKLHNLCKTVLTAKGDRMPTVGWQETEVRRFKDNLYLMQALPAWNKNQHFEWDLTKPLFMQGNGYLHAESTRGEGLCADVNTPVSIRFRLGGEVLQSAGGGRRTLKNLFQEWGVPTWKRDRIPLIYLGDQLIGVVGFFIDRAYKAEGDRKGYRLILKDSAEIV